MSYKYALKEMDEKSAKAVGISLSISAKHAEQVCNAIRGKRVDDANALLERVIAKKEAIPFRRHLRDLAHRKAVGPGRYPVNTCKEILKLVQSATANAQFKGLSVADLRIKHVCAHIASRPYHQSRHLGRKMKRSHVEVVLEEKVEKEKPTKVKPAAEVKK
ncbi:MAG: 50S ribosomal protein L22 [Candidatus Woesearchaeota archaeon]